MQLIQGTSMLGFRSGVNSFTAEAVSTPAAARAMWVGDDGLQAATVSGYKLFNPTYRATDAAAFGHFDLLFRESAEFAAGARGVVPVFFGTSQYGGKAFLRYELPELIKNIDTGLVKSINITF